MAMLITADECLVQMIRRDERVLAILQSFSNDALAEPQCEG
jgi:hypothetical protein